MRNSAFIITTPSIATPWLRVRRGQQRALPVKDVVEAQDEEVEQVAPQHVGDAEINRANTDSGHGDYDLRQRGRNGNEQTADKRFPESSLARELRAEPRQPERGTDDEYRGTCVVQGGRAHRNGCVLQLPCHFARFARAPLALVREDHPHADEVHDDEHGRVETNPSDRWYLRVTDQTETGDADEHQAEPDGERMALVAGPEGLGLHRVHQRENQEIEHAAAQDIAHGNIGEWGQGRRAETREQFRQAGRCCHKYQANPAASRPDFSPRISP